MKKVFSINIKTFLLKVLVIFFIGFTYRILIYHCLGINVLLDYTNYISILYYSSLLSLTIYIDQLFSFHLHIPINSFNDTTSFNNDFKTTNFLFTKDHNASFLPDEIRKYSRYTYLRPIVNGKGNILLVPGLNLSKNDLELKPNIPPAPKPSNLSTPSTMSPLFPDSSKSDSSNEAYSSRSHKSSNLSHTKSTGNVPIKKDKRLTLDLAERRLRIIEYVSSKKSKPTICDKISSGLNYADSSLKSKFFKEPSQEMIEERCKKRERELERRAFYTRLSWKKER